MLPVRYGLKQLAKVIMHQRMHQGREEVQVLIAATDLRTAQWEDEREFRLHGQMYDVAGIEYHEGQKYYRCVADERETRIETKADQLIRSMAGGDRSARQSGIVRFLSDWLQGLYFNTLPQFIHTCCLQAPERGFLTATETAPEDPQLHRLLIPPENRKA
jgi:hypothetical protein